MSSYIQRLTGASDTLKYLLITYVSFSVLGFVLNLVLPALHPSEWFFLPVSFSAFLHQPWSLLSWPFISEIDRIWIWTLLMNSLFLYQFGMLLQGHIGEIRFRQFLVFSLVFTVVLSLAAIHLLPALQGHGGFLFGLSGPVAGCIAAVMVLIPRMPVGLFLFGNVPVWIVAALVLVIRLTSASSMISVPEITAVVSGALSGALYVYALQSGRDIPAMILRPFRRLRLPKSRPVKGKFTVVRDENPADPEAEVNRLLDKISKVGYSGLSKNEKEWLERYSRSKAEKS